MGQRRDVETLRQLQSHLGSKRILTLLMLSLNSDELHRKFLEFYEDVGAKTKKHFDLDEFIVFVDRFALPQMLGKDIVRRVLLRIIGGRSGASIF